MATITSKSNIKFKKGKLKSSTLKDLYSALLTPRMIEQKMLSLLRQGKISKWFSGIGQEAISVGCTEALNIDEIIFPMHRNLGVFTSRNIPLHKLFAQWQGKIEGFTKGRDRSFHFGTLDYNIVGMISHLGPQLSLADGVALANKLKKEKKLALAFTGEGGTSQGEFHEALNVAAVWQLPVIFVIENNGYGLSTPKREQFRCAQLADKGKGYGMATEVIDGNNVLEVYRTIKRIAKKIRNKPEPYLVECMTFRMRGHEEASGTKYVPKKLMEKWAKKDPLENFETYLLKEGILTLEEVEKLKQETKLRINDELKIANDLALPTADIEVELTDIYSPHKSISSVPANESKDLRLIDAIADGLDQAMKKHKNLVLMGQDIAEYGGVFKITEGLMQKYGKERVRNTPLCESAILGISLGLSFKGMKSMVEMQFSDFVSCGFNQIVNNLAKVHYRWGQNADVVIRMPSGGGVGAGPFHSQSTEAWFAHVPGLKIVYPSNPADAKGLLLAAFEDPNPVLFFEHKALYRSTSAKVPTGYYTTEIGKADLAHQGSTLSIITYGMGVHWAKNYVTEKNLDADILDLRTLNPLDYDAIRRTVQKTSHVIILHEDTLFGGIGGEISAYISENLFPYLDAPIVRCASLDTPVPFSNILENQFMASARLEDAVNQLLNY
jgi:2-oxoisovalerate dehydrogenase E1 component